MPAEEAERFAAEYISLFALAKQQGRHFLVVKKELDAAGIKPCSIRNRLGRRSIVGVIVNGKLGAKG